MIKTQALSFAVEEKWLPSQFGFNFLYSTIYRLPPDQTQWSVQ